MIIIYWLHYNFDLIYKIDIIILFLNNFDFSNIKKIMSNILLIGGTH